MKAKLLLFTVAAFLGAAVTYNAKLNAHERSLVKRVQSGELTLRCNMKDGVRDIPGVMVVGMMDYSWTFKNGYSKSCTLIGGK